MNRPIHLFLFVGIFACSQNWQDAKADIPIEPTIRIRYSLAPDSLPYDADNYARLLDLNDDGIIDYKMIYTPIDFGPKFQTLGNNRQAAVLATPPDLGSLIVPFNKGELLSKDLPEGIVWVDQDTPNHGPSPVTSTLNGCSSIGCGGLFTGIIAFMGVHFETEDGMHYGWVRIDTRFPGGVILDWAYDTRPDVPILAGAMPGEGVLVLQSALHDGFIILTISGQLGKEVTLERSTNFADWTPIRTQLSPFQTGFYLEREPDFGFFRLNEGVQESDNFILPKKSESR